MAATEAAIKGEDKREKLLQAAARCFIASGFHGARMAQIAKEAQMSPGHIYHYFESKEQIIAEMVRAHALEKQSTLEKYERAGDQVVDLMVENLDESVDSSTDPFWSALMLEMTAEATRNPEIASILRNADAEMKARVLACLGEAVEAGDLETRLEILVALFQGLGVRNILNPALDKAAVARLVKGIVEALLRRNGEGEIDEARAF
ncbi:MAG TPA: TetR/AcrR family transcriptional regulator [Parvularculaceae bacterium]|nr:TetR/AcrR family transcriptional regulator [Parvularculaceae bacterium]